MEYGYSMLLKEHLHCTAVSYEDCKDKLIVCPNERCHEPVFKRGNEYTQRQYLCHYPAKGQPDCELRVFNKMLSLAHPPKAIAPKGQELEKLLKRFNQLTVQSCFSDASPKVNTLIRKMCSRDAYRKLLYVSRNGLRTMALEGHEKLGIKPIVERVQLRPEIVGTTRDALTFLTSPVAFASYIYAVSLGLGLFMVCQHNPDSVKDLDGGKVDVANIVYPYTKELIEYDDRSLHSFVQWAAPNDQACSELGYTLSMALVEAASQFSVAVMRLEQQHEEV